LAKVGETYKQVRNTLRYLLSNLYDFNPDRDAVPRAALTEVDRWILSRRAELVETVRAAYEQFEFHKVYHALNAFCTVDLSAFYLDILKDRMYIAAPNSAERRSSQTAMFGILTTLLKLMAPALPFTSEEAWQQLPDGEEKRRSRSVHAALIPQSVASDRDEVLEKKWEQLLALRRSVALEMEKARQSGLIGKSLEARVIIRGASEQERAFLAANESLLPMVLIVSQATVEPTPAASGSLEIQVEHATGKKCVRCWNWRESVGASAAHPELCAPCVSVVEGMKI
jgi:isoleucyl-tRNA synthetase